MSDNDVDMPDRTSDSPLQDLGLQEFRDFLTVHWPDSKLAGPGNSGITCLIATIRHLLGFFSQGGRCKVLQFADEAEQKHDVPDNERGVLRAILQGNVRPAVEQIKAIFPEDTTCSFETLIFSDPYRRSMWNNPFFQVYLRRMLGPNAKPDGHPSSQGYQEDPHFIAPLHPDDLGLSHLLHAHPMSADM
ncbi:hypothetical protein GE21DRAFT_8537 [Neurospora crassa]|uniref:Uncharacterized protein n=2 Tax=Neurospora crassa TaxID=5141 RepID=Q1K5Y2_NEUCR|nr:hypothetical protein NCU07151 [Neurospora crassa OR74A]EAA28140.1 hypothetical protein NCU07151 [Neurospora crassa OR74A]KHE85825.1 hypothetical protein GE21DRAFT_8537 [Neurospora crassa]CAD71114.1 conserved hypothetical protein [Neurospora crassa]|eukprot:XP_957376.1 hypothetical protein NCU07151 [Neurospora crassa OR74A]